MKSLLWYGRQYVEFVQFIVRGRLVVPKDWEIFLSSETHYNMLYKFGYVNPQFFLYWLGNQRSNWMMNIHLVPILRYALFIHTFLSYSFSCLTNFLRYIIYIIFLTFWKMKFISFHLKFSRPSRTVSRYHISYFSNI